MPAHPTALWEELHVELNRLVVRRTRVALLVGLTTVVAFAVSNHLRSSPDRLWGDLINGLTVLVIGIAFLALRLPAVQRRPVPFALAIFAFGCFVRASAGVDQGDVAPTAIILVALALVGAATMPWGSVSQIVIAATAGAAIAINGYLVTGALGATSGRAVTSVVVALVVSVGLALELQRHHVRTMSEILRRRQAERRLAELNAELEQHVRQRTEQLHGTMRRLEREVQEHQQAIEDMRESERRLQDVLDHAMAAIYLRDTEGRYVIVNRYWQQLAGLRAEDVVGKTLEEIMSADTVEALQAHNRLVLESLQAMQFEESIRQADGIHTWVSVKFPQFDRDGRAVGVWGISTDITERKRAEEQARRHQAELAHVLRLGTIDQMAAGFAHEIHQPLGAVANYGQGAVHRIRAGSVQPGELLPIIEAMVHEALRAGEIIRRVRELVRKEPSEQLPFDVNALVRESVQVIDSETRNLGVEIRLALAPDLPPLVCNGVQVEQVIVNLLRNALEAMPANARGVGRVTVTSGLAGPRVVEVSVCDNGVGLPEPSIDVFAPFQSTKARGLGMGLSISRSIVEAHHGTIRAVRNPGGGSTFAFTLPVGDAPVPAADVATEAGTPGTELRSR
jgi:two-component system, LuxR family, sensor kinase FixL